MKAGNWIVITGAGGLVGRAVCEESYAQEVNVLPVVRKRSNFLRQNQLVLDLSKGEDLVRHIKGTVSGVIHLAAEVPHSEAYADTEGSASVTRQIDDNVLSAVKKWGCPVVYMSSCGLYDRSSFATKYEKNLGQVRVEGSYFSAKYDGEAKFSADSEAVILRLAAPIGKGLKAGLVVSHFIELARTNQVLKVWGSGMREQDFIDVGDVAKIVIGAIQNPHENIYNVASGEPTTMRDLAQKIVEVVGSGSVKIGGDKDPRDGDTARYSIALAQDIYGWVPQVSLEKSLRSIIGVEFER